jgi:hypothetical protein
MRKIVLLAMLTLGSLTVANAQDTKKPVKKVTPTAAPAKAAPTKAGDKVTGPGVVYENEVIDYGTIKKNADGKREFTFVNNGTEPLVIKTATGSCGCTVPTKPTEPIAPGARGVIGVKYATDRVGPFTKTVTVTTNASDTPKVLTIKGNVLPEEPVAAPKG